MARRLPQAVVDPISNLHEPDRRRAYRMDSDAVGSAGATLHGTWGQLRVLGTDELIGGRIADQ